MGIITTKHPKSGRSIDIEKDFGATTAEKVEMFGEDVCNSCLDSAFTIKFQASVRAALGAENEDGTPKYSADEVTQVGLAYRPQKAVRGKKKDATLVLAERVAKGEISKKDLIAEIERQLEVLKGN